MNKKIFIIALSCTIAASVIGSASWIIAKSIIESTEISKNDISEVDYFTLTKYSADKSTSSAQEVDANDYLSKYLGDDPILDGYYFDGWYDYNTQAPIDENQVISSNISVYPVYTEITSSNSPTSSIDNVNVTPGDSSNQNVVNITDDTLGSGNSLDVPYDSSKDPCNTDNTTTGSTTDFGSEDEAVTKIVLQTDLIIESGATFNLGAQVGYSTGTGPNTINGAISGGFTTLDLNGHNIIVYGTLQAYGLVTNSRIGKGMIYVANGGTVITPFCILDFAGGGNLVHDYTYAYSPFSTYSTPYLSCTTIIEYGGILKAVSSLNASDSNYPTEMFLIGPNSSFLIQMEGGYAIDLASNYSSIASSMAKYIPSLYREKLVFTNKLDLNEYILPESITYNSEWDNAKPNIIMNSLNLEINVLGSITVSMSYVEFPISSYYDISFYKMNVVIKQLFEANPYATIYLDSESTLQFSNNSISYVQGGIGTRGYINSTLQYPGNFYLNSYCLSDLSNKNISGKVIIDGDLVFDTNSTSVDAEMYELGGYIDLSNKALKSLENAINNGCGINLYESSLSLGHITRSGVAYKISFINMALVSKDAVYSKIPAQYYNYPLVSYGIAYFIQNNELKKGEYNMNTGIINVDSTTYSFVYNSDSYLPYGVTGKLIVNTPAPENNIANRINNTLGSWQVCSFNEQTGIITVGSLYYAFYNGAYIHVNSNSSSTTYYIGGTISQKIYTSASKSTTEKYNQWKFCQFGCESQESTTLNYDSNTKTWNHG
ncbi:MAG: hypothetical protein ACI311_06820 [Bacilli bacterium]